MATATSVRLVFSSQVRLVDLAHAASERMAEMAGFEQEEALSVALAVREAVINAIVHGNRSDPELKVDVTMVADASGFRATVLDRGNGFDPGETPDPTVGDNRLKTSGRGLLLVRAYVDDLKFRYRQGRGMEVKLAKWARPPRGCVQMRSEGPAISRRTGS